MKKAVIFDWAGVVGTKPFWLLGRTMSFDKDISELLRQLADEKADTGVLTTYEYLFEVSKLIGKTPPETRELLLNFAQVNDEVMGIINGLRVLGMKVLLLSNANEELLLEMLIRNRVLGDFDAVVASSRYKVLKPDPGIFQIALDLLGCRADETVFVDDTMRHVEGAQALGIAGIYFQSVHQLTKDLQELQVL